jgi:hypothetical protein
MGSGKCNDSATKEFAFMSPEPQKTVSICPTIKYTSVQAVAMIDDSTVDYFRYHELKQTASS